VPGLSFYLETQPQNQKDLGQVPVALHHATSYGASIMLFEIQQFITGPIETNTYVVSDTKKKCCIVDPSSGCKAVFKYIDEKGLDPVAIILTHGHFDHILGIPEVLKRFPGITVWVHPLDAELLKRAEYNGSFMMGQQYSYTGPIHDLKEGRMVIGGMECTVLHIPGHTPGGCALVFDGHCLAGDSLFAGSVGRTDFEYGDGEALIRAIREKLLSLHEATVVHPGHMGRTTIGREKRMNPFLQEY
jgi:hydroxyacylglutathione hydrolase